MRILFKLISVFLFMVLMTGEVLAFSIGGMPKAPLNPDIPGWFIYTMGPGESYDDVMVLRNDADNDMYVDIYAADSIVSSGGGFALKQKAEEMEAMGSWIVLPEGSDHLLLKAGGVKEVPFTITIPEDVDVGETSGAILFEWEDADHQVEDETQGIKINLRTGVRVYNVVPGNVVEGLSLDRITVMTRHDGQGQYYLLRSDTENFGNVSLMARYVTTITNTWNDEEIANLEAKFMVNRGSTFENNQELRNLPRWGKLRVDLVVYAKMKDGTEKMVGKKTSQIIVLPITEISIVLLFILIVVIRAIYRARKYSTRGWVEYRVRAGETLVSLAERRGVQWKFLAIANGIRAPYTLYKDDTLMLPKLNKKISDIKKAYDDALLLPKLNKKVKVRSKKPSNKKAVQKKSVQKVIKKTVVKKLPKKKILKKPTKK